MSGLIGDGARMTTGLVICVGECNGCGIMSGPRDDRLRARIVRILAGPFQSGDVTPGSGREERRGDGERGWNCVNPVPGGDTEGSGDKGSMRCTLIGPLLLLALRTPSPTDGRLKESSLKFMRAKNN